MIKFLLILNLISLVFGGIIEEIMKRSTPPNSLEEMWKPSTNLTVSEPSDEGSEIDKSIFGDKKSNKAPRKGCPMGGDVHYDGIPVNMGQFPFHVLIFTKRHCISDFCGGTIIHENWILTSGYCLYGHERIRAYGGVVDVRNLAEAEYMSGDIHSDHFVIHPAYKHRSGRNNIGLFYVCEKIRLSRYVTITNLPLWSDKLLDGTSAMMAGYGSIKKGGFFPERITEITKQIENGGLCDEVYEEGKFRAEQHLCLKNGVEGPACVSDHGGGLVVIIDGRQAIHGIFNFYAEEGCEKGFPDVYVRVANYLNWIYTVTGIPDPEKEVEQDEYEEIEVAEETTTEEEVKIPSMKKVTIAPVDVKKEETTTAPSDTKRRRRRIYKGK